MILGDAIEPSVATAHWTNEAGWELPQPETEAAHRARYPADWARYEFAAQYASGAVVIDCACGPGYGSALMARAGAKRVIGVDASPDAVEWARGHYAGPTIEYRLTDGKTLPVEDGGANLVVSFETIEHVPEREAPAFLERFANALAPGGRLVISTPLTQGPERLKPANPFHLREYDSRELAELLEARFEVLERLGQHSRASERFSELRRVPGVGSLVRAGVHRVLPGAVRSRLRSLLSIPSSGRPETRISAERWTEAPVQVLVARRR